MVINLQERTNTVDRCCQLYDKCFSIYSNAARSEHVLSGVYAQLWPMVKHVSHGAIGFV